MDNLKLQKMQFVSLNSDLKIVMDDIDTAKNQKWKIIWWQTSFHDHENNEQEALSGIIAQEQDFKCWK